MAVQDRHLKFKTVREGVLMSGHIYSYCTKDIHR